LEATPTEPVIRKLVIERFRGIQRLEWRPAAGLNVILGGGDVGKTTVLEAIALLLSPTNSTTLSEADYWQREVSNGFCIEAVMSLPDRCGINQQARPAWPWRWDGRDPVLPDMDGVAAAVENPVYRVRVSGSDQFDLSYEVVHPDDEVTHFSVTVRRSIGVVKLSGDDRNRLEEFIADPEDELTGERLRTLADRLRIDDKDFASLKAKEANVRNLIIEAATGAVPDWAKDDKQLSKVMKKHSQRWFKSLEGGRELANKVFTFDLANQVEGQFLPFLNAVRAALSMEALAALPRPVHQAEAFVVEHDGEE
jgi:hypothetical protein